MKEDNADISIFDQYHQGLMDETVRREFEERLQNETDLREEYDFYKSSLRLIQHEALSEDIATVLHQKRQSPPASGTKISWMYYGIAASIILIIVSTYWILMKVEQPQIVYESLFKPYPNVISTRSTAETELEKALRLYDLGKFEESGQRLGSLDSQNDTILFYQAQCRLSLKDIETGIVILESIDQSSSFKNEVTWYLAVAYIGLEDYKTATSYLKQLEAGDFKYEEALRILERLP